MLCFCLSLPTFLMWAYAFLSIVLSNWLLCASILLMVYPYVSQSKKKGFRALSHTKKLIYMARLFYHLRQKSFMICWFWQLQLYRVSDFLVRTHDSGHPYSELAMNKSHPFTASFKHFKEMFSEVLFRAMMTIIFDGVPDWSARICLLHQTRTVTLSESISQ